MKSLVTYLLLLYFIRQSGGAEASKYTTKYDGVNLDEILASTRLLNGYINCLLDVGACTPDGKELKNEFGCLGVSYISTKGCPLLNKGISQGLGENCHNPTLDRRVGDRSEMDNSQKDAAAHPLVWSYKSPYYDVENLPDAISNDCSKCTERQQQGADQVMHYIIDHRPDDWIKLEEKYNSDGSYKRKYLDNKKTLDVKAVAKNKQEKRQYDTKEKSK